MRGRAQLILTALLTIFLLASGVFLFNNKKPAPAAQGKGIISLLPSNTEILFELGAGPDIIAVSNYCNWPPEVKNIPHIGDSFAADVEAVYALRPAIVYLPETARDLEARLDALNIPNTPVPDAISVAGIYDNIALLAAYEDINPAPLTADLQKYTDKKPPVKARAFLELDNGLWTTGSQSFVSDYIEYAGAENIFKNVAAGYFQPSLEAILAQKPDIIISIKNKHDEGDYLPRELKKLKTIRLNPDIYARPTPRAIRAIPRLAAQI